MINEKIKINADSISGCASQNYAAMYTYIQEYSSESQCPVRPMILLCPGGGYSYTSDREAEPIATKLLAAGFHVCILRYSCSPSTYPTQLIEAAMALKYIREHAKEWHVCENQVFVMGASAGGHLAASIGIFSSRPWISKALGCTPADLKVNGMILMYPVITSGEYAHRGSFEKLLEGEYTEENLELLSLEKQVDENTPPAFIWHTYEDGSVPVENSLLMVAAMRKHDIPVEFHMYPSGHHGLATADYETNDASLDEKVVASCSGWLDLACKWVRLWF